MGFTEFTEPLRELVAGQAFLVVCCTVYLIWWCIAFRPGVASGGWLSGILLLTILVLAARGVTFDIRAVRALSGAVGVITYGLLAMVVAYLALLFITVKLFHRVPTTELLLIVFWGVLETAVFISLRLAGFLTIEGLYIALIVIGVTTMVSLVCYVVYYRLDEWPAFYCGMLPLGLDGIVMTCLTAEVVKNLEQSI
ncbi:MAG: hypothetical protein SOZ01_08565 [Selenomonadaceae bacterium]|nr:hypothetical protein [Selenomonadaceae bacterium]